jgi:hypothetical protein
MVEPIDELEPEVEQYGNGTRVQICAMCMYVHHLHTRCTLKQQNANFGHKSRMSRRFWSERRLCTLFEGQDAPNRKLELLVRATWVQRDLKQHQSACQF